MRGPLSALVSAAGIVTLVAPACAYAEIGLKQEVTSEGTVVYFDFDGLGYALIIIVALVLILRGQRASLKRVAEAKRRRAAKRRAAGTDAEGDGCEEDLGASALAAVERLKRAEQDAHRPRGRRIRLDAKPGDDDRGPGEQRTG